MEGEKEIIFEAPKRTDWIIMNIETHPVYFSVKQIQFLRLRFKSPYSGKFIWTLEYNYYYHLN